MAWLSLTLAGCLSAPGIAAAETQIYYGFGDGDNTGDISGVNWILNKDYSYYGGHQCFFTAYTINGSALNNTLTINGGNYIVKSGSNTFSNYFYGGLTAKDGNATGNGIIINSGNFINESGAQQSAGIYAAQAMGKGYIASDNYTFVNDGIFQGYTYIAAALGYGGSDAINNNLTVNNGTFEKGIYLFGGRGYSTGNTDNNTVKVTDGDIGGYRAFIWGGKADDGNARYNTVNLSGGLVASIPSDESIYENKFTEYEQGDAEFYGGYTLKGDALYNTVNISGGSISTTGTGLVYGGYSRAGNANYNTVNVSGGTISSKMTLIGGFAADGDASGNTINLTGGSGNGEVYLYGGMTMNSAGNANGNKIAIYIPARLKDVYGGVYLIDNDTENFIYNVENGGDLFTGNELYLATSGISVNNIYNFETLNFYLPPSYKTTDSILTVTGNSVTDLTNTKFNLSAAGGTYLTRGQAINLITSNGEIIYNPQTSGKLKQGFSLNYNYTLINNANNLQAVLGDAEVTGETKSLIETRAAQTAFLNRGADLLTTEGLFQAEKASDSDDKGEWSPFFAVQGGKYRYKTGSHVDSRGFSGILGVAKEIKNDSSKLIYGLAGEYGKGNYDSYCNNIHGEGDTDYTGATIFVRQKNNRGMYYEGSLRAGKTKADYQSKDFTDYEGLNIGYDTSSKYFGAHLGLGKTINLNEKNNLDISLRYFYSHTGGDSVRVTTGETYNFSAVNSHRIRLGVGINHAFNDESKGYVGAYYEREFNGDAKAAVFEYSTATPSIKGNSGIFEIGWLHQPKNSNFNLKLGATLACGKQRGGAGNVSMIWQF